MKVCHLGKFYPPAPGGMEAYTRALAMSQAKRGVDVSVFCMNHLAEPTYEEKKEGVKVVRFRRDLSFAKLDYCRGLVRAIQNVDADLFHLHVPNPTMILAYLSSRRRTPVVVTYQSDIIRQRVRGALFRPVEHFFYSKVQAILPTSQAYVGASRLLQRFPDRVIVVPIGIDLEPFLTPSAAAMEASQGIRKRYPGPLWLCTSRMIYYKGLETAIQALKYVPGSLILIGDGPERDRLSALTAELGLEQRVFFLGQLPSQKEVIPYYLAATALWFPSNERSEAFGLVQVEAMASGCPVVNTNIPGSGVTFVCPDGECGLTVPTNDPRALAAAAQRLLSEKGLRESLGMAARRRAAQYFNLDLVAGKVMDVYEKVLGGAPQKAHSRRTAVA